MLLVKVQIQFMQDKPMNNADAIADIAKIGIFGDIPIKDLLPLGGKDPYLESEFNLILDNNQTLANYRQNNNIRYG